MGPRSSQPLFKLLHGVVLGSIVLANPLSVQSDPVSNNRIIQQQVDEDILNLKILVDNALALEKEGKYKEAAENWELIIELGEKYFGPHYPDIAPILNKLGNFYYLQGKYSKAEPLYIRSLGIKERALGANHADVAISLNNLAELYRIQGKYSKAEPLYNRSLVTPSARKDVTPVN